MYSSPTVSPTAHTVVLLHVEQQSLHVVLLLRGDDAQLGGHIPHLVLHLLLQVNNISSLAPSTNGVF